MFPEAARTGLFGQWRDLVACTEAALLHLSGDEDPTDPFPLSSPLCLGKGGKQESLLERPLISSFALADYRRNEDGTIEAI